MVTLELLAERQALLSSGFTAIDTNKGAIKGTSELIGSALNPAIDLATKPASPILDRFPGDLIDTFKLPPFIQAKPEFESSYKGLIDGINDLSGQIDAKKAELSNPDLDPSKRMELSIEMQELMQMRLQMITITTNLLKTDHDSAQAVNNNLRA
jgi:hypothetical protein